MAAYNNRTFAAGEVVPIDGHTFAHCRFDGSILVFAGFDYVSFQHCVFNSVQWRFDGPSARVLAFLTSMYHGGAQEFVENTFAAIRSGTYAKA